VAYAQEKKAKATKKQPKADVKESRTFGDNEAGEFSPLIAENAHVPPGFKIEKIFEFPRIMIHGFR